MKYVFIVVFENRFGRTRETSFLEEQDYLEFIDTLKADGKKIIESYTLELVE